MKTPDHISTVMMDVRADSLRSIRHYKTKIQRGENEMRIRILAEFSLEDEIEYIDEYGNITTYIQDGDIRLIFREGRYEGWYRHTNNGDLRK